MVKVVVSKDKIERYSDRRMNAIELKEEVGRFADVARDDQAINMAVLALTDPMLPGGQAYEIEMQIG